jgi:hypothetical protein
MLPLARIAAGILAFVQRQPRDPAAETVIELADGATVPPDLAATLSPLPPPAACADDGPLYWWEER